jgi:hypothetical protein
VKQLGNSYYAMIAHQMKLKPAKADAPVKLRRCLTTPPLAVGLVTVEAEPPVEAEDAAAPLPVAAPARRNEGPV